jgi:hypothetical protein
MALNRDMARYREVSSMLAACNLSVPFMDKPPRLIGAGSYNDIFCIKCKGHNMVLRLSYYSSYTLNKVQALIQLKLPYKQLIRKARGVTDLDPVTVKNNYSQLCNMLVDTGVCPHFVYMFHQKDVKCFAAMVRDQIKPERMRNNLSFRYNNVSFHEKYQSSLRLKLKQLTDLQLVCAVFQVLFALAVLQHYVPNFRHNDLSLDNVLVSVCKPTPNRYVQYCIGGVTYWLPDAGIMTAVTDFDLAHAPATVTWNDGKSKPYGLQNQLIAKDQFGNHTDVQARNINASANRSFDTYYFLYRLREALGHRPSTVQSWLRQQGLMQQRPGMKYVAEVYPSLYPSVLLANAPLFAQFKKAPGPQAQVETTYEPVRNLPCSIVQSGNDPKHGGQAAPAVAPPPKQLRKVTMHSVLQQTQTGRHINSTPPRLV